MRYALIGTAALVAFASATYACGSDSDNTAVPTPDAGKSSTTSSSSSGSSGDTSSSSSSSGSTTSSSSSSSTSGSPPPPPADAGTVSDGGGSIPDGGPRLDASGNPDAFDGAAGTQCLAGSVQETEDNDTDPTANTLPGTTGSFCGSTSLGDPDFVKFTLPVDASNLTIGVQNAGAAFQLDGTVEGQSFTLFGADAGTSFPFKPGKTYSLKASTAGASSDYIIGLTVAQSSPTLCKADSVKETEGNDTEATANTIPGKSGGFCGTINTEGDVDTLTFTLPETATGLSFNFKTTSGGPGSFKGEGTIDGKTFTIPKPAADPNPPFIKGKPYVIKLSSTVPNNSYLFEIAVTP